MTTTLRPSSTATGRDTLKAIAAGIALVVLVVGIPAGLSVVAPIGLPSGWPDWAELRHAVMRPDDGRLALAAIQLIAWVAWAAFAWSVVIETRAALHNTTAREVHLLGALQRGAAVLVGAALLLLVSPTTTPPATAAGDVVAMHVVPTAATSAVDARTTPAPPPDARTLRPRRNGPSLPVVTVDHGDSLWSLAERHLGDGERFVEIFDLNLGRTQPDGHSLSDAHWIDPGWQLLLPADATNLPIPPAQVGPTKKGLTNVVVQAGDTLWTLAQRHLGDGERYPEIVALNSGVPQADGGTLQDPDLIRPGWVLTLPSATAPTAALPGVPRSLLPTAAAGVPDVPDAPSTGTDAPSPTPASVPDPALVAPSLDGAGVPATDRALGPVGSATTRSTPLSAAVAEEPADTDPATSPSSPVALSLGLTALAAAGLIGELARRRRLQHRVRRTGERIAMPAAESPAARAERVWHAAPTPLTITQIRNVLANLATTCFADGRELPRLAAIEVAADHVDLHVVGDGSDAVPPFTLAPAGTWTAPTATLAAQEPLDDPGRPEPYPALVTVGHTETSTVLVNLEAAGTLRVNGDPDAASGVLRALVAELATSDLSARIGLTADQQFAALSRTCAPARLQAAPAPVAAAQLSARLGATDRILAEAGLDDTLQARSEREAPDLWLPVLYLTATSDAPSCPPWCGSVLLTGQPGEDGWTLTIDPTGTAHLDPLDLTVRAQRLDEAGLQIITELLGTATTPETPQTANGEDLATRPSAEQEAQLTLSALPTAELSTAPSRPDPAEPPGLRINILGPVRLKNVPSTGRRLSLLQTELLVYLTLHPQSRGPEIDDALWPGTRVDDNRRHGLIYRTRRIVLDAALPIAATDRTLQLGPTVTSDWQEFQRLAASGLSAGPEGVNDLQRAIDLVRGRPLRGVAPDTYAWADLDIDTMINAVVDVAHTLSRLLLDAGDARGALTAAKAGLLADTCSQRLRDDAIAAALADGDADEARRIRQRYDALLAELDEELV
ncbi:MAG TPA: LysM peptidoglycan-binding domain-containing protein [Propionicimonas sp.]|jgi:nucleoid-associated protein YgaU